MHNRSMKRAFALLAAVTAATAWTGLTTAHASVASDTGTAALHQPVTAPVAHKTGPGSGQQPPVAEVNAAANSAKHRAAAAFYARRFAAATSRSAMAVRPAATWARVNVVHQAQERSYYCGPATFSEILTSFGHPDSQSRAAELLGTTSDGTDWYIGWLGSYPMRDALNREAAWYGFTLPTGKYEATHVDYNPTDAQRRQYVTDLVYDIDRGQPIAADAYEAAGIAYAHLPGHPVNKTIYHWIAVMGYDSSGDTTEYTDSAYGASSVSWSNQIPLGYNWIASQRMVDIVGDRGYVD